jgi:predicted peptidase
MPFPSAALAVAADGRSVAVARMHLLELVTPRGRKRLATDAASVAPLWTHDGRSLVYFDLKGRLVVRNVTTGAHRALVPSGRYMMETLSPDGKTVYLLRLNQPVSIPK